MRNVVLGSFIGCVLAVALLAACGSSGDSGPSQATIDALEQQLAQLQSALAAHEADAGAHHDRAEETPWLGLQWCIALQGVYPSRNLEMPGEGDTHLAYEPNLGSVAVFAGDFVPRGWAACSGQLLLISQHTALYSLVGTTFGGDGTTTFALPDLRGRAPVSVGTGVGLSAVTWGQRGP